MSGSSHRDHCEGEVKAGGGGKNMKKKQKSKRRKKKVKQAMQKVQKGAFLESEKF